MHRFFHPSDPPLAGEIALSREEAHHAMHVLRVRRGDAVELFNGRGSTWKATVADISRAEVTVAVGQEAFAPRPEPRVTLAQAWLHRDKILDELVRETTVLGVERILFYRADHSEKKPRIAEKWERVAVDACKQCRRPWLPAVDAVGHLADVLVATAGERQVAAIMDGPHAPLKTLERDRRVTYIVGPEGDFSEAEIGLLRDADALPLSLGQYTLRSETAALAGLTLIQHHLGHLG